MYRCPREQADPFFLSFCSVYWNNVWKMGVRLYNSARYGVGLILGTQLLDLNTGARNVFPIPPYVTKTQGTMNHIWWKHGWRRLPLLSPSSMLVWMSKTLQKNATLSTRVLDGLTHQPALIPSERVRMPGLLLTCQVPIHTRLETGRLLWTPLDMANDTDGTLRRRQVRPANKSSSTCEESPSTVNLGGSLKTKFSDIALVLSDFALILILVFGGCCSWVYSIK